MRTKSKRSDKCGLSLIELLMATAIMAALAVASMSLISAALQTQQRGTTMADLEREGLMAMSRMTVGLKLATIVAVPNGHNTNRDMLAFSRLFNSDADYYFNDPLFPRVDEDPHDYFGFGSYGITGLDDDGDGSVDESNFRDEDEDGVFDEDPLDGLDNDADGTIDEEVQKDHRGNGAPGIAGFDDDGDGSVDEGSIEDDDEDGTKNEEDILFAVYTYDPSTSTLMEIHTHPATGIWKPAPTVVLSERVKDFKVTYKAPDAAHEPSIKIELTLLAASGETVSFTEIVCPRNILQQTGKRVK